MNKAYIEQILSDLDQESCEEHHSHFDYLDWILGKIDGVPSPERESLLVQLLMSAHVRGFDSHRPQSSL